MPVLALLFLRYAYSRYKMVEAEILQNRPVRTGDVDVMVSVGNNFFYTLSLPCSLWFFDRNKHADIRDKVL